MYLSGGRVDFHRNGVEFVEVAEDPVRSALHIVVRRLWEKCVKGSIRQQSARQVAAIAVAVAVTVTVTAGGGVTELVPAVLGWPARG